ncbi:MAG: spermidine synthase [Cocleimonas sp.]|jgi:spermidine synthase
MHIFEEIDFQNTPLGEISLRKRSEPRLNDILIYEVKMNEEFLMSSLFVEAELQLAHLGLADLTDDKLDVIVGGLGLGYTAFAALENQQVSSLKVIDVMAPVIDWHQRGLVPMGPELMADDRCELVLGDFFSLATSDGNGFGAANTDKKVHAVLLDIDHTPDFWLSPGNNSFYTEQGLRTMAGKIHSGGVFALWSDDLPDDRFTSLLDSVFDSSEAHVVTFPNPYTQSESSNSVYVARKA